MHDVSLSSEDIGNAVQGNVITINDARAILLHLDGNVMFQRILGRFGQNTRWELYSLILFRFGKVNENHEKGDQLEGHVDHGRHIALGHFQTLFLLGDAHQRFLSRKLLNRAMKRCPISCQRFRSDSSDLRSKCQLPTPDVKDDCEEC